MHYYEKTKGQKEFLQKNQNSWYISIFQSQSYQLFYRTITIFSDHTILLYQEKTLKNKITKN